MVGQLATIGRDLEQMFQAFSAMAFVSVPVALIWEEFYVIPALLITGWSRSGSDGTLRVDSPMLGSRTSSMG
jgi:hypothetical protein